MQPRNDIHHDFAAAVLGHDAPPLDLTPHHRLSIYRNNVEAGLVGVLRARYPAILRLLGEECFSGCARRFIAAALPTSPVLLEYGADFPRFLSRQAELQSLFYLHDVACLEWARHTAVHAADADGLDATALAQLAPEQLPGVAFAPHPSARFIQSAYPIETIWRTNRFDVETLPVPADAAGENVLVTRVDDAVVATLLPPEQTACVAAILEGRCLGDAAHLTTDLSVSLAALFKSGALAGFRCDIM